MRKKLGFVVIILCIFVILGLSLPSREEPDPLTIYFFDVGQADAMLLRTPLGDVLIDAGSEQSEPLLCLRLEQLGVERLKLAVFTHFDEDHIGGADAVLRRFGAEKIWINSAPIANEAADRMICAARETDTEICRVSTGEAFALGDLFLMVLHPTYQESADGNASSVIVRMQFGNTSALFMGDAGVDQEAFLLEWYGSSNLSADLCKLGHHGSDSSTSDEFLTCIKAQYAVITCADPNPYGHPWGIVMDRLEKHQVKTFCTGWQGEIVFESDGERLLPQMGD